MNVLKGVASGVASGVSGAANTVASTASKMRSGKSRKSSKDDGSSSIDDNVLSNAMAKVSMTMKSSPIKDFETTSYLSVKSGELRKRNEQGGWHKVRACLVPHWFLYYFESEHSEHPRGILDLHLYTKTSISGNASEDFQVDVKSLKKGEKVLKLSSEAFATGVHDMYFSAEEEETLREWVAVIKRDRYEVIRDERDAYLALQEQFSGELEKVNKSKEMSESSKDDLVRQIAAIQTAHDDLAASLQRVLSLFGTTEEDMRRVAGDGRKTSELCTQHLKRLLRDHQNAKDEMEANWDNERSVCSRKVEELERKIEEAEMRIEVAKEESRISQEKDRDATELLRLEIAQAQVNLSTESSLRQEEEEKSRKLIEEKRVLVKEVKALRRKLESSESKLEQVNVTVENMMALNDQLSSSVRHLTTQKQTLWEKIQEMEQQQEDAKIMHRAPHKESNANSAALYTQSRQVSDSYSESNSNANISDNKGSDENDSQPEEDHITDNSALWQEGRLLSGAQGTTAGRDMEEGEEDEEGEEEGGTWRSSMSGSSANHADVLGTLQEIEAMDDKALVEAALRSPALAAPSGNAEGTDKYSDLKDEEESSNKQRDQSRGSFDFELMKGLRLQELSWRSSLDNAARGATDSNTPSPDGAKSNTSDQEKERSRTTSGGRSLGMNMEMPSIDISEMAEFATKSATDAASIASKVLTFDPYKNDIGGHDNGYGENMEQNSSDRQGSLLRLSDSEPSPPSRPVDDLSHAEQSGNEAAENTSINQFYSSPVDHDTTDAGTDTSKRIKVNCLRCGGSVAGPKHSTCSCKEPLIADLSSAQGQEVNEKAPDSNARWDRRKEEAKLKAGEVSRRLSVSMVSMSESMSRAAASFSATLSSASAAASASSTSSAAAPSNDASQDTKSTVKNSESPDGTGETPTHELALKDESVTRESDLERGSDGE